MKDAGTFLRDLTPEGVDRKPLGEIGTFIRGRRFTKADYVEVGLPSIHYGEIYTTYGTVAVGARRFVRPELRSTLRLASKGDIVIAGTGENVSEVGKAVAWMGDEPVAVHDDCFILTDHGMDPEFLSYFFQSTHFHEQKTRLASESKLARISGANLATVLTPIPAVKTQVAIAQVLKQMERLEAELEAELEARRLQLAHYRRDLLTSAPVTNQTTLGQCCARAFSGGTPLSTRPEFYGGDIPWLRTKEVNYADIVATEGSITAAGLENSSATWVEPRAVIVALSGAGVTKGRVAVTQIPLTTNQHCLNLEIDESRAHFRFVYHWLVLHYEALRDRGQGNRGDLNARLVKDFPISLPPIQEQTRLAHLLDTFEALVSDLTSGLPAEIAARRTQYEYYRDRLLSFEPA